jgi:hypothetical protein
MKDADRRSEKAEATNPSQNPINQKTNYDEKSTTNIQR